MLTVNLTWPDEPGESDPPKVQVTDEDVVKIVQPVKALG
jgi:hypothetical protein